MHVRVLYNKNDIISQKQHEMTTKQKTMGLVEPKTKTER